MRLIDADAIKCDGDCQHCQFFKGYDIDGGCEILEMPTAYDVDTVLGELEANAVCYDLSSECHCVCDYCRDCAINRKKAIDIVKRGGVND